MNISAVKSGDASFHTSLIKIFHGETNYLDEAYVCMHTDAHMDMKIRHNKHPTQAHTLDRTPLRPQNDKKAAINNHKAIKLRFHI